MASYVCPRNDNLSRFMKKLVFLPFVMFLVFGCSSDSESLNLEEDASVVMSMSDGEDFEEKTLVKPCFPGLSATVSVDVSNGLGNPIVVFQSVVTSTIPSTSTFRVRVEVQPLSDCDDMNSISGASVLLGSTALHSNITINDPSVPVQPSVLPLCYKWRMVFEGMALGDKRPACTSVTPWYEAPLF